MTTSKPPKPPSPWPAILRKLRAERGWTQLEAAEAFGVARITWLSWENDKRTPKRTLRKRLREVFSISA